MNVLNSNPIFCEELCQERSFPSVIPYKLTVVIISQKELQHCSEPFNVRKLNAVIFMLRSDCALQPELRNVCIKDEEPTLTTLFKDYSFVKHVNHDENSCQTAIELFANPSRNFNSSELSTGGKCTRELRALPD
jgi:hypothetical protein